EIHACDGSRGEAFGHQGERGSSAEPDLQHRMMWLDLDARKTRFNHSPVHPVQNGMHDCRSEPSVRLAHLCCHELPKRHVFTQGDWVTKTRLSEKDTNSAVSSLH